MSLKRTVEVTCQNCSNKYKVKLWNSINVTVHEEEKERILGEDFFNFQCPRCGDKILMGYDTLYHDMTQRVMIYLIANYNKSNDKLVKEIEELSENILPKFGNDYRLRIVNNHYDLIEKIKTFDYALDDRIMEISKIYYSLNFKKEQPDLKLEKICLDYDKARNKRILRGLNDKGEFLTWDMDNEIYNFIKDKYSKVILTSCKSKFQVIDKAWATETINTY